MSAPARRRSSTRTVLADRALEALPLFRLSDSAQGEEHAIQFTLDDGARWRVLPSPGDRLPGTFDQDVHVALLGRFQEAGYPGDGVLSFTLHAFLRGMGRRADGRTYEQLRSALTRLERTTLESTGAYFSAAAGARIDTRFSLLTAVAIERRRAADADQLGLFPGMQSGEPGIGRVTLAPLVRENIRARHTVMLAIPSYLELPSPVARRLYRLLTVVRAEGRLYWQLPLERLAEQLPLVQRYPSHLARVLQPAHEMLLDCGLVRAAEVRQDAGGWIAEYAFGGSG
ncbi:MAG: replication initiator protein A [Gemmatimonadaceae bacterium]|nr:replication initiator protein A [Gemmatimonadaceae bacterium]